MFWYVMGGCSIRMINHPIPESYWRWCQPRSTSSTHHQPSICPNWAKSPSPSPLNPKFPQWQNSTPSNQLASTPQSQADIHYNCPCLTFYFIILLCFYASNVRTGRRMFTWKFSLLEELIILTMSKVAKIRVVIGCFLCCLWYSLFLFDIVIFCIHLIAQLFILEFRNIFFSSHNN